MTSASRLLHLLGRSVAIHTLLGKNDLVARDLDRIVSAFPKEAEARLGSSTLLSFVKHGKAAEAEKLNADQLVRLSRPADSSPYSSSSYQTSSLLEQLVQLYGALGRHEDIVRLLDDCPLWSAGELARLGDMFSRPVPLIAAKALAATGRKNDAERIARWAILTQPNDDAGYALLTELNPPDLIPFLDQVATGNRFEERPLIWKANALAEKGALDEAETLIRKAIAIDPSDGEQGKGNRMRAYEVLADILGKKGDAQQSGFFRKVVSAIRQSEEADDWWSAGLIPQAIARYQKALESFADAYCIQSRLALRYASVGDKEKAAVHFQRAFELMPDSFGRIESHCFGCEGAFNSETAQAIAEKVFTELASRPDAKPQVHYLLGYLRSSQGRSGEATVHFRKAVEMDPDYINAWKKLAELPAASSEEADEVTFALLRLSGPQMPIDHVSDLRRLWDFLLEAEKTLPPPPPSSIYPLRAAAAARPSGSPQYGMVSPSESLRSNFTRHPLVNAAGLFFEPSSLRY